MAISVDSPTVSATPVADQAPAMKSPHDNGVPAQTSPPVSSLEGNAFVPPLPPEKQKILNDIKPPKFSYPGPIKDSARELEPPPLGPTADWNPNGKDDGGSYDPKASQAVAQDFFDRSMPHETLYKLGRQNGLSHEGALLFSDHAARKYGSKSFLEPPGGENELTRLYHDCQGMIDQDPDYLKNFSTPRAYASFRSGNPADSAQSFDALLNGKDEHNQWAAVYGNNLTTPERYREYMINHPQLESNTRQLRSQKTV